MNKQFSTPALSSLMSEDMEKDKAFGEACMALGALRMLSHLEPAISDGTRHGSSECAKALQALPNMRGQCIEVINKSTKTLAGVHYQEALEDTEGR